MIDIASGTTEVMLDSGPVFIEPDSGSRPDGSRLMVTTTSSAQLLSYRVEQLRQPEAEVLCTFDNGWPDGMAVTQGGDIWVALTGGDRLDRVGATGQILGNAPLHAAPLPTNVCLSGERGGRTVSSAHSSLGALVRIRLSGRIETNCNSYPVWWDG